MQVFITKLVTVAFIVTALYAQTPGKSLYPMQVTRQQAELQRQAAAVASQGAQVRAAHVHMLACA